MGQGVFRPRCHRGAGQNHRAFSSRQRIHELPPSERPDHYPHLRASPPHFSNPGIRSNQRAPQKKVGLSRVKHESMKSDPRPKFPDRSSNCCMIQLMRCSLIRFQLNMCSRQLFLAICVALTTAIINPMTVRRI